ncbi:hypothetical protein [Nocardioides sp. CER19]|uniref:hypothetical protein n=1 Tax=Nocardioides sp. CER19 TaxID=3038538 RepID=UPI002449D8F6|nr:hypothetical protein [Nocardioides sp. CER19]MDH2413224.1 hypothetical protein [Nocardioides sp. CER19]
MTSDEKHPIAAGFVALVAVGLAVGLLLGVVTLVATRVAGLGGSSDTAAADSGPSLYLPTPVPTSSSAAAVDQPGAAQSSSAAPTTTAPAKKITLQAGSASVASMQRIDLSGTYPGGEGSVLQVQRLGDGKKWEDFPVTAAVSGETFSTYVQTGRSGVQQFRVRDSDSGMVSNVVSVTVR